jgi:hypothetical protein
VEDKYKQSLIVSLRFSPEEAKNHFKFEALFLKLIPRNARCVSSAKAYIKGCVLVTSKGMQA